MNEHDIETQITAYALNELDEAGRAEVEALLADRPDLRAEVAAMQAMANDLTAALGAEAAATTVGAPKALSTQAREAIMDAGAADEGALDEEMASVSSEGARTKLSADLRDAMREARQQAEARERSRSWLSRLFGSNRPLKPAIPEAVGPREVLINLSLNAVVLVAALAIVSLPLLVFMMSSVSGVSGGEALRPGADNSVAQVGTASGQQEAAEALAPAAEAPQPNPISGEATGLGNRPNDGRREAMAQVTPGLDPDIRATIDVIESRIKSTEPAKGPKTGGLTDEEAWLGAPDHDLSDRPVRPWETPQPPPLPADYGDEDYGVINDNPFIRAGDEPLSTFSIDVDTASYANVRRFLTQGQLPPPDAVRIEELLNYFTYSYPTPAPGSPFAVGIEVADAPWAPEHRLVRIGLKGREVDAGRRPSANLVFLVDVSGSMDEPAKLPLVRLSLKMLAEGLRRDDRVAIVVYAGAAGLVLPSTVGAERGAILAAIDGLQAGGSTNGGEGIQLAYQVARQHRVPGGVNRVILVTDGDFNVGITDQGALVRLIQDEARSGIALTTLGYGFGNLKDSTLEQLADKGNGNYGYVDSLAEARKLLVDQMLGTLVTIAKDVKIQVEFNPTRVAAYRLIGYENRILAAPDFNDDAKDAGEIGSGHTVTALYEIVPVGKDLPSVPPAVDPLRYGGSVPPVGSDTNGGAASSGQEGAGDSGPANNLAPRTEAGKTVPTSGELLFLKLRYKAPDGDVSQLATYPVRDEGVNYAQASADFQFASALAAFGMLLRESPYRGEADFGLVQRLAERGLGRDEGGARHEFLELLRQAQVVYARERPEDRRYKPIFP